MISIHLSNIVELLKFIVATDCQRNAIHQHFSLPAIAYFFLCACCWSRSQVIAYKIKKKKNLLTDLDTVSLYTIIFKNSSTKLFVDKSKYFCETYLLFHHNFTAD